eukprot:gene16737-23008_t
MQFSRSSCAAAVMSVFLVALYLSPALAQQPMDLKPSKPGKPECAKTCHENQCNSFGIRYGKYCGVGHGGCAGEEPCDEVDACCRHHDDCVDKTGVMDAEQCHEDFLACLAKHAKTGKTGFSETCPWDLVIPTMKQGIEMAAQFSSMMKGAQMGGGELGREDSPWLA